MILIGKNISFWSSTGYWWKKNNKRGNFKPNKNLKIFYLNTDAHTNPDFLLDANNFHEKINQKFDYFFLAEILEHLDNPTGAIKSSYKILKR